MQDSEFTLQEKENDDFLLVSISGAFNSTTSPKIKAKLLQKAEQKNVLLDLSGVTMLSSAGVGVLFELIDTSSHSGKKLILVNPSERVKQVIHLTGFNEIFTMAANLEEAQKLIS